MEAIKLKSLVGKHKLSGVDFENESVKLYEWSDLEYCQVVRFCLDGKTYMAVQDPSDGYRSCMKHCLVVPEMPKNKFEEVEVYGVMKGKGKYNENDVIQFYDTITNKIILEIGTSNANDYYPSWVAKWYPENLCLNIWV
jgi:hypothetical protein